MFTANWVIIIVKDKFECQIVTSFLMVNLITIVDYVFSSQLKWHS